MLHASVLLVRSNIMGRGNEAIHMVNYEERLHNLYGGQGGGRVIWGQQNPPTPPIVFNALVLPNINNVLA